MFYLEKTLEGWAGYHNGIKCTDYFVTKELAKTALYQCSSVYSEDMSEFLTDFDNRKVG